MGDSVIGRDFQELSAEEQERQREEWKAELKKTEEEILTLKQVLTAKERHAAGLKRRLGITAWREFSEDMTQGLKNLQESATYKRTAENIQFAKEIAKEKTSGRPRPRSPTPCPNRISMTSSRKATDRQHCRP